MKRLILIFWFGLTALTSNAAHLVGGEISYECVGSNVYEITLKIYRDCNSLGAPFDVNAAVGIFKNGQLTQTIFIPKGQQFQLPVVINNPCLSVPPNVCTEMAIYKQQVYLPADINGYTITYQRCCRNQTINNIPNPGAWGNTYTIDIPPNDTACNSSPEFISNPPIVLCMNDTLNINAAASESDGDSLFYELCDPLHGGSQQTPAPNPPSAPPYTFVPFLAGFSNIFPLNANPPLQINSNTGLITGKPIQVGQFVFAICVSEYRNGVLLSTVRRDYQFNVTNCISSVSTQIQPQTQFCSGKTINFKNTSFNVTKFFWDFGDPNSTSDTSNLSNPTYTYTDTGTFQVKLVVNKGWSCSDSSILTIKVHYPVKSKYNWFGDVCFDQQELSFIPDVTVSNNATYFWWFGLNASTVSTKDSIPPPISFNTPGKYYVTLQIDDFGCSNIYGDSITIYDRPEAMFDVEDNVGCAPYTVTFNDSSLGGTKLNYIWDFGDGNTSSDPNPTHTYDNPGVYAVNLIVFTQSGCIDTSVYALPGNIIVNPSPEAKLIVNPTVTSIYKPGVEVIVPPLLNGESSQIIMDDGTVYFDRIQVYHEYKDTGNYYIKYVIENQYTCKDSALQKVRIKPETNIFVPNAFTPNNDNRNDIFLPEISGAKEYEFIIFSRWGDVVFKTNEPNEGWNGNRHNTGDKMPMGVYTYVINIRDLNEEYVTRSGTLSMLP